MPTSCLPDIQQWLRRQIRDHAYPGYVYGYPHKKAYRPLLEPQALGDVWRGEDRRNLFCYLHVPFCNQRCSFCNLFTFVPGDDAPGSAYVAALGREMDLAAGAMDTFHVSKLYLGGGTPTYLTAGELRRLVDHLRASLGIDPAKTEGCIECSPETLDGAKVGALRELGFRRISLGVQSFRDEELRRVNRRFDPRLHDEAIHLIGRAGFAQFNIDLIYGLPGQTAATWAESIARVIDTPATSAFLYPLYVRPLTGLGVRRSSLDSPRTPSAVEMGAMYDLARDRLARAGFRQLTMRQFRREAGDTSFSPRPRTRGRGVGGEGEVGDRPNPLTPNPSPPEYRGRGEPESDPEYRCQHDAMLGLGAGARSYTARLHYSTPWKMVARNIRGVVDDYVGRMGQGDDRVSHGFVLDDDERRRRFVIQTLLFDGLDVGGFEGAFGRCPRAVFAEPLSALDAEGLIRDEGALIRLTALGVRHADIVGQLFFSDRVRSLTADFEYDQ